MLWTCFAANGTVHFLAACFVERASFALQSARFRNNAHVYSRQSARSKNKRGERRRLYKQRLQSTRLEPLGSMKESKVRGGDEKLLCINTHWAIRVSILSILQKGMLHFAITVSDSTFSLCPSNIQGTPSLLRHPT